MGYLDEDGCFDLDNPDFADDYVFDYILQNLYPKGVEVTPEITDLFGSWESKLLSFEKLLPTIKFPVTESEFVKDKELQKRVEKFNNSNKEKTALKLEPLYYLTLYLFSLSKAVTVDSVHIEEKRINQLTKILNITKNENSEITFKAGKDKFVLIDKSLIQFLFNSDKIISSIDDEVYRMLNSTGIVDLNKKSENFSYTDASSVFAGYFFEYLNSDNSAKELIAYLTYISGLVVNDSIIVANDYINILLRNYKQMQDNDKKQIYPNIRF
jgi:hypothetical protein